ncbi:DUF4411 family protein [Gammaproteobacteria bacterium]|nr:DUF4411 family protein [Gammaproteobacteria bacterium]
MRVIDASSIVYGWDNYPIVQFPPLWKWIGSEIGKGYLVIPSVALDEVVATAPDCGAWLKDAGIEKLPVTNLVLSLASAAKSEIGVVGDAYHAKGVGENDLLIISTAKAKGVGLISDEGRQKVVPKNLSKMKIPAVCDLPKVSVSCINFIEYIKGSKRVFV